jgi:MFS family permease
MATTTTRRRASGRPSPPPATGSGRCVHARRPGSSTTSTTGWRGGWSRSSWPLGAGAASVGLVAALYPGVWSVTQIATGHWSDSVGRKPLIVGGMLLQAAALGALAVSDGRIGIAAATSFCLGLGTALVYPTLIAAMSDAVTPVARAPVVGVYRFWRDMGYALGAVIAGTAADRLGYGGAIAIVAALTAASGLWVLGDMPEPPRRGRAERRPARMRLDSRA